ncbi:MULTISPECIES: MarR family winged helix-turn-helix transcriptional regulator [Kordiimonas]|jgi:DNA-binding MarR family transcriptional regulator|uniref:MarR family winged helix-turn-helix transcriptional regulator n=1 Tax=Kordiimonas TaxID=288021 RepID=UPI0025809AA5|nr:MarR family transcriptional regulator [Kordiimonas sp. UBA4487]
MDHVDEIIEQWAKERPDLDTAPMALLGRLLKLQQHTSKATGETFNQFGLNAAAFDVLATLRRSGPPYRLSPGALMDMTMVTSGTMTNRIDQLVKAGLVERIKNPDDGRGFLIALTDKGFKLVDEAVTAHVETQKDLTSRLSDADRETLSALVKKYLATFEE